MTTRSLVLPLILAAGGLVAGVRVALWPLAPVELPDAVTGTGASVSAMSPLPSDTLARLVVVRDPFRVARHPAAVAYDPMRLAEQLAPTEPRPALTLVGLVASHDPTAVVQGLPGTDGPRVLRVGDLVGGIRLRRVAVDTVWLVGLDTTWVLRLKE